MSVREHTGPSRWRWPIMAALLVATALLGWKAWQVNLAQTCWLGQWPNPDICAEVVGVEPKERLARLEAKDADRDAKLAALMKMMEDRGGEAEAATVSTVTAQP